MNMHACMDTSMAWIILSSHENHWTCGNPFCCLGTHRSLCHIELVKSKTAESISAYLSILKQSGLDRYGDLRGPLLGMELPAQEGREPDLCQVWHYAPCQHYPPASACRSPYASVRRHFYFLLQWRLQRQFSSWLNANKLQKSTWPHTVALRHYRDLLATAAKIPRGEVPKHIGLNQTWFTITNMWVGWAQMVTAEHSWRWLCSVSCSVTSIFFLGPANWQSEFCWL